MAKWTYTRSKFVSKSRIAYYCKIHLKISHGHAETLWIQVLSPSFSLDLWKKKSGTMVMFMVARYVFIQNLIYFDLRLAKVCLKSW